MEERRPRERELVLAPNEYAYVLDTTKGQVNCYVGPNKTSLAQTDQPVIWSAETKRFEAVDTEQAIRLFATAPANWYMILKNPAQSGAPPTPGLATAAAPLLVGKKVAVWGPASFPLWPGQMARIIEGHRLRSNQYLWVRIYEAAEARRSWHEPDPPEFVTGELRIIRGTELSFYMPPTGVEVVPDEDGRYVRDAVVLGRLEYCVLEGEDGKKTTLRGEAVVFPRPEQRFVEKNGQTKFRAIELSEITGLHLKVIAPWVDEEGALHEEGEELFLTGRNRIYVPREEHAIVRTAGHEIHHAVAIPRGQGRYVLDRLTGEVSLVRGPQMLLPDPRRQVLTRRVLSDREVRLLYPGNEEALAVNRALREGRPDPAADRPLAPRPRPAAPAVVVETVEADAAGFGGADISRAAGFVEPRTITLGGKYDGAVSVEVWSGFAVQVVDRSGGRRVVQGPATVLLAYDETLEALSLSTGTPKSAARPLATAFLRVAGNKVSDEIELESSDMVRARLRLTYRVSFEGDDPSRWFAVDDYVKLLCDHGSSMVQAAARRVPVRDLVSGITDLVRDAVLGRRGEDAGRVGLAFADNGMRVHDVEVLALAVTDAAVAKLLEEAQGSAIQRAIRVADKESSLAAQERVERADRVMAELAHATQMVELELEEARARRAAGVEEQRRRIGTELSRLDRERELADAELDGRTRLARLGTARAEHEEDLRWRREVQALLLEDLAARVQGTVQQAQAFAPELVAALTRLGDAQLLSSLAENFGELAAVEGKGLLEVARKFLDFVPLSALPALKGSGPA